MQDTVIEEIISVCNVSNVYPKKEYPSKLVITLKFELSPCLQGKVFVLSQEEKRSKGSEEEGGKSVVVWSVELAKHVLVILLCAALQ